MVEAETVVEEIVAQQPDSSLNKSKVVEPYLDREGGYADESVGKQAELAAMCQ